MSVFIAVAALACIALALISLLIKAYARYTCALCTSTKKLDGRTCIVNGGTTGIGLEIAKDLARRNARVIITCPFPEEGKYAETIIKGASNNNNVVFKLLNLASFKSVREFAADILSTEDRLDILMNNAGILNVMETTEDGLCFIMQVNYFGHFLLTLLLLPLLKKTGNQTEPSRIVNTASNMHYLVPFGAKDIKCPRYFKYCTSKLCLIHFTKELSRRLEHTNVVVNAVHPGIVGTTIYKNVSVNLGRLVKLLFKSPFEGAQTALHAILDTKAGEVSGKYFDNCKEVSMFPWANNAKEAKEVWDTSLKLVKLSEDELQNSLK